MIRLRQSLERGMRHPLVGPFLLLLLGLVLAFVVFHAIEDGVAGQLFTCALLAAAALRLVVLLTRTRGIRVEGRVSADRGPLRERERRLLQVTRPTASLLALPLRR